MSSTSRSEPADDANAAGSEATAAPRERFFTTRTLLICAALAVITAILAQLARVLGVTLQAVVPWLAFPAPVPWFLGILIAVALFRRPGIATVTAFIGMIASAGGLVLVGGIIVELVFLAGRYRRWDPWRFYLAAALIALVNFGFMYLYGLFTALPIGLQLLALAIRLALYLGYTWLALWVTARLEQAGIRGTPRTRVDR